MNFWESTKMLRMSFDKITSNSILKDDGYNARILYAGPRSENSMIVYRILELSRGRYVLEQTIINTHFRSVQTTLATLNQQQFHKHVLADEIKHQLVFQPNTKILSAVSYTRDLGKKTFFSRITPDLEGEKSYMRSMCDFYLKWKMNKYLNKRI